MKPKTVQTQLECRATAELRRSIVADLSLPDKPIDDILSKKDTDKDESNNQAPDSD